jgi:hypothetical protein
MNANADHISGRDALEVELFQSLIRNQGIAVVMWRCRCHHIEPTWGNHAETKRNIARVNEVNAQILPPVFVCTVPAPQQHPREVVVSVRVDVIRDWAETHVWQSTALDALLAC